MLVRAWWVIGLAGIAGCAEQHDFDAGRDALEEASEDAAADAPADSGRDAGVPDAGALPVRCGALPETPRSVICEVDVDCDTTIDERPLAPSSWLDRPSIAVDASGRPTILFSRYEEPTIGVLATRDGRWPWTYERLTTPMVRGAFALGLDEVGAPCSDVLLDDGDGTVLLVEHRSDGDVVLDRIPGTLGPMRSLVRTDEGLFGLVERDGAQYLGFRGTESSWQETPLRPSAGVFATLSATPSGARIGWLDDTHVHFGVITRAGVASGSGPDDHTTLRATRPGLTSSSTPELTGTPRMEMAFGAAEVALTSDLAGDLVLSRRGPDGAWRNDVIGVGSIPSCGPPVVDATCALDYRAYVALGVVSTSAGHVVGLFTESTLADVATGFATVDGVFTEPELWPELDVGPPVYGPPEWWWGGAVDRTLFLVIAESDAPPRILPLAGPGHDDDGALALGPDGTLHIVVRDRHGYRYLARTPRTP